MVDKAFLANELHKIELERKHSKHQRSLMGEKKNSHILKGLRKGVKLLRKDIMKKRHELRPVKYTALGKPLFQDIRL
jgi:hypothetical protein